MAKTITIKLTKASSGIEAFKLSDQLGNIIADNVSKHTLINGISYKVGYEVTMVTLESLGTCKLTKTFPIGRLMPSQISSVKFIELKQACLWRHLTDGNIYNNFYGNIEPYILEYPFSYQYQDQILQNVKDYTKSYLYSLDDTGVFDYNNKVEVDAFFNKAVVYNGQQSSGVLELITKPKNDMHSYMKYPILGTESKQILVTKSDNFYQYNTFWSIVKDKTKPLFLTSCTSLTGAKLVNQDNMDYGLRSFKKEPLKAKELKIRHTLDNRDDIHLVSQFIIAPSQISYK